VEKEKIKFIFGGLTHKSYFETATEKRYYKKAKSTFDICFVAAKYMQYGIDKGYDVFVKVCEKLASSYVDMRFHVVGGFNESDIDVSIFKNRIKFYGYQNSDFFPDFYSSMDIILSPNLPFKLYPGSFDGFPTGCCSDAALHGVAVFCTDPLHCNIVFKDKQDICIITENTTDIIESISYYYNHIEKLYELANNGKKKFQACFDFDRQISERIKIFNDYL
jgi:glycosyltransferase involved in cell wall biosynthesis